MFRFTPESVRWLRTQNRLEEGEAIFKKIAKKNKRIYPKYARLKPVISNESSNGTYKDLFFPYHMCWMTLSFSTMWYVLFII